MWEGAWGRVSGEKPQARGLTAAFQLPSLHASGIAACSRHVRSNVHPRAVILAVGRVLRGEPQSEEVGKPENTCPPPQLCSRKALPYLRRSPGSPETLPGRPANPEPWPCSVTPASPSPQRGATAEPKAPVYITGLPPTWLRSNDILVSLPPTLSGLPGSSYLGALTEPCPATHPCRARALHLQIRTVTP